MDGPITLGDLIDALYKYKKKQCRHTGLTYYCFRYINSTQ